MSVLPDHMPALLLKQEGFSADRVDMRLDSLDPYLEAAQIEVPRPGPAQVLIRVRLAPVNPSDVMFIKGLYGQPRKLGRPAGFEGVGEVVAAGDEAGAGALVGQRVAFAIGQSNWGSWAQYALADARACIPLRPDLRDEDGAALIVNPLTALAMFDIVRQAGAKSFILTAGASQLSKLIMGLAREEGFRPVAVVRRDDQTERLIAAGAAHVVNAQASDFGQRIAQLCKDEQPRILLDAVTGPQASTIFQAMGRQARWIIYGQLDAGRTILPEPGRMIFQGKRVEGFWLTDWMRGASPEARAAAVKEAQARFADGRWATDVTATVPLGEAMSRLPDELAKPNGKVFIAP